MAEMRAPGARELAARAEQAAEKQRQREAEQRGLITFERRARMRRSLNRLAAAADSVARGELTETEAALAEVRNLGTLSADLQTTLDHIAASLRTRDLDRAAAQIRTLCDSLHAQLAPRPVEPALPSIASIGATIAAAPAMTPEAKALAREHLIGALPARRAAGSQDVHTRIPLNVWLAALHPPKRQMRGGHAGATAALVAVMLGGLTAWRTVQPTSSVYQEPVAAEFGASDVRAAQRAPQPAVAPPPRSQAKVFPDTSGGAVATSGTKPPPASIAESERREPAAPPSSAATPPKAGPAAPVVPSAANRLLVTAEPLANPRAVAVEEMPIGTALPAPPAADAAGGLTLRLETPPGRVAAASVPPDKDQIDRALDQYRQAYERLDARAARAVWPGVNERALARAFEGLESQGLNFDNCEVDLADAAATAVCQGSARYVPKVGSKEPQVEPRRWTFKLRKSGEAWEIETVQTGRKD